MKISVIIPVYNSSKTILNTLEAILNQTFPISEVIIIDDRSKDDTILVIKKLIKSDRDQGVEIRLIENDANQGPGFSRNIGISIAKNKVIAFCDSDDIWRKDKLEIQIKYLGIYPIIGSNYRVFKDDKKFKLFDLSGTYEFNDFLKNNYLATSTVLIDLNIVPIEDLYFENIVHEDYYLWLRLLKKYNYKVIVVSEYLMNYFRGNLSYSSGLINKLKATFVVFMLISNNPLKSLYYTIRKVFNSLTRYI